MKGIILEKRDGFAAVLREDGTIVKLRVPGEIGDRITVPSAKVFSYGSIKAAVAAAVVLMVSVLGGGYHHYLYGTPVSYVTLETDRAIELSVNRNGEVISVAAVDNDAKDVVSAYQDRLTGRTSMDIAVETAVEILYEKSAPDQDRTLSLNVASDDSTRQEEIIEVSHTAAAKAQADYTEFTLIRTTVASSTDRETAKTLGISTAKLIEQQEDDTKTPSNGTAQPASDASASQNTDAASGKSTAGGTATKDPQDAAAAPAVTVPSGNAGSGASGKTDAAPGSGSTAGKTDAVPGSGTIVAPSGSGTAGTQAPGSQTPDGASAGHGGDASGTAKEPTVSEPAPQDTPTSTGAPPVEAPAPSTDLPPLNDSPSEDPDILDVNTPPLFAPAEAEG